MLRNPSKVGRAKRLAFQAGRVVIEKHNAKRAAVIAGRVGPSPTAQKRAERDRARKRERSLDL